MGVITTKGHGGFMFTKDDHLKAVYSSDIDAFLEKLEVLEQFNQGKFACKYCKEVITRNNLYAIIPMPNKKVVFLHGCFWHRHPGCPNTRLPKSNIEFWENKLLKNVLHDELVYAELEQLGWRYLIIWECEMKKSNRASLEERIHVFMDGDTV